ncbi:phage tail protein [Xenorhabdus khoisanae]|nr:phage tail protein [Xenorhabdus khoisanae]MDC9614862.1 phage tail protein [Xenorhabdus khoisanae]
MSTKYFALLTQLGAGKLANAAALGTKLDINEGKIKQKSTRHCSG